MVQLKKNIRTEIDDLNAIMFEQVLETCIVQIEICRCAHGESLNYDIFIVKSSILIKIKNTPRKYLYFLY